MPSESKTSNGDAVFRHESGAEIPVQSVGYAAMHGQVYVEGSPDDESIHLNGYYYERATRPAEQAPSRVSHPWPTITLSRSEIAELCDVIDREATGDSFDYPGVTAGHLYVAYDDNSESFGRDMDTEERIYAVPDYQVARIEFPISHLSARGTDDGVYRFYGYNPDGPSAEKRMLRTH